MTKIFTLLFLLIFSFTVRAQSDRDTQQLLGILKAQTEAWNKADLEGFMNGYWKSDKLKFIGKNGITYGWQSTLDNYRKNYPTPEKMGTLTFEILSTEKISSKAAFVIGKWHLKRATDEISGHFSLLWKKINGQWVIVADHSS